MTSMIVEIQGIAFHVQAAHLVAYRLFKLLLSHAHLRQIIGGYFYDHTQHIVFLHSANTSCSVTSAAVNVFADTTPSFLASLALSTVRS